MIVTRRVQRETAGMLSLWYNLHVQGVAYEQKLTEGDENSF